MRAGLAAVLAMTACATAPVGAADPTTQQSPFPTGKSGTTIHVTEYSTATADVTLNNVAWVSSGCTSSGGGCNVIELTIVGKSDAPFSYSGAPSPPRLPRGGRTRTGTSKAARPWSITRRSARRRRCARAPSPTAKPRMDSSPTTAT
nr:hypothetical protein [Mycobacterium genavense]